MNLMSAILTASNYFNSPMSSMDLEKLSWPFSNIERQVIKNLLIAKLGLMMFRFLFDIGLA